jgi:hypothetical protein
MFRQIFRHGPQTTRKATRANTFRPSFETLEHRLAPATVQWNLNADGFFDDPNNWDVVGSSPLVHRVPGAGDLVVANVASTITITVRDARVVDSLNISERMHIVSGGSLTVDVGSSNSISQLTLDTGGTLDVTGLNTVLTPGDGSVYAGAVNVDAGAKLTFGGTVAAVGNNINAGASLTGQGQFEIDGLAIVNFNTSLTLPNNMLVQSTTFDAVFGVSAGATVTSGQTFTLQGSAAKLEVAGTFSVASGDSFNWQGGNIQALGSTAGNVTIQAGGTLNIQGTGTRSLSTVTLNNAGNVNWPDPIDVTGTNARFNNLATGVFNITNDANFGDETWIFTNQGTVNKSSSNPTLQTFIIAEFDNTSGTVNVNSGTLEFFRGTNTSTINTVAGTRVAYRGKSSLLSQDYFYAAGASFTGPGILEVSGQAILDVNAALSVQNLALATVLQGTGNLTVNGTLTWNVPGQMKGTGTTILAATGTANLIGDNDSWHLLRTFTNNGVVNWTGASTFDLVGNFNNQAGGVFNAASDAATSTFGAGTFNNAGTLHKSSPVGTGATTFQSSAFNNTGLLDVVSGVLALNQGGTSSGTFNTATGATVSFTGGTYTLNAGTTFTGTGTFLINNGTVIVNANLSSPSFALSNGALDGTGNLTVTGTFDWTGGTLKNPTGTLTIPAGATLAIRGNTDKNNQDRTINLSGTANWTETGNFNSGSSAVLNVLAGGVFNIQSDAQAGSGTWNNAGTINKTAGSGTTSISVFTNFSNNGIVNVLSGTFDIAGVYKQFSGTTNIAAGAALISSFDGHITISGGKVQGNGSIGNSTHSATVTNSGTFTPGGASPGTLTIFGSYTQTVTGNLNIAIGGLTAGTQYSTLTITGAATLNGTLNVALVNGFVPAFGNVFVPLTFASRTGTFGVVNGTAIPGSLLFQTSTPNANNFDLVVIRNDLAQTFVWVAHLYQDMLGRTGTDNEVAAWVNLVAAGLSRQVIVTGFIMSPEYRAKQVKDIYLTLLHRAVDPGGLSGWVGFLQQGHAPEEFRLAIISSTEYFQLHGSTNQGYVSALYNDILHRQADPGSLAAFTAFLNSNPGALAQVASTLFASLEYRQDIVNALYTRFLRRAADPASLNAFAAALQNGSREDDIILALVASNEYFLRP